MKRSVLSMAIVIAAIASTPLLWRPIFAAWAPESERATASYIPALEPARARAPFDPGPIADLQAFPPGIIVIGDSMAGRIHKRRLEQLSREVVAPLLRNATGSAHWFLIFKNYVVQSGVRPKTVVVFFRETNLTDPLFRLGDSLRGNADPLAHDFEPELNAAVAARAEGAWFRVHRALDRFYGVERTRRWLEPRLTALPGRVDDLSGAFALDRLRSSVGADMGGAGGDRLDFTRDVGRSLLPAFLSLARQHGLRLMFVRVLRRPENGRAPGESPALRAYIRSLKAYIEAGGAIFRDDRDYPGMAALPYDDGDHIARAGMVPYTELFYEQMAPHLK